MYLPGVMEVHVIHLTTNSVTGQTKNIAFSF
jgi:hypothetical protein